LSQPPRIAEEIRPILAAMEHSPDAVFVTDRTNHILAFNHAAESLLGHAALDAVGTPCAGLLGGSDGWGNRYCSDCCPLVEIAGRGEAIRRFDLRLNAKTGAQILTEVTILQLAVPPPHHFYLVHILKPSDRGAPALTSGEELRDLPRSALTSVRESPDARARKLTHREVEILGLIAAGRTTPEIASSLCISALTVRNHTQNILDKLEVHSKAEAVAFAFQKRLI
jgi:DNA-binding CsgD family transcriptional regulator